MPAKYQAKSLSGLQLWRSAGFPASSGPKLMDAIEQGLPVEVINKLNHELNMQKMQLLDVTGINQRSFARRKAIDGKLKPDESERVVRFVRVTEAALELFENDKPAALEWMHTPLQIFDNKSPIQMLTTETGAIEVLKLIGQLEYGVFV